MRALLIYENFGLVEFQAFLFIYGSIDGEILQQEAKQGVLIDKGVEIVGNFGVDYEAAEEIDENEIGNRIAIEGLLNSLEFTRVKDL